MSKATAKAFTSLYTHNRQRSKHFATINVEESMTQQTDKDDSDINVIVGRFMKTGQLPDISAQAIAGDFTDGLDFREMLDRVNAAKTNFETLPAPLRARFENDPAKFLDFATNRDNLEELRKLKLAEPERAPEPPLNVRVIPDAPAP